MATVQVRNLDDRAYETLKARAAESGRSLQEYLRRLLEDQAARPSLADQVAGLRADVAWSDAGPTVSDIVDIQREQRAR